MKLYKNLNFSDTKKSIQTSKQRRNAVTEVYPREMAGFESTTDFLAYRVKQLRVLFKVAQRNRRRRHHNKSALTRLERAETAARVAAVAQFDEEETPRSKRNMKS